MNPYGPSWLRWDRDKATYTVGISSGGGNTAYSAGVSWNGQTGASIGYANGGVGFGYNPSRPGNLYTPMPGNSNSIDQMVRQQVNYSIAASQRSQEYVNEYIASHPYWWISVGQLSVVGIELDGSLNPLGGGDASTGVNEQLAHYLVSVQSVDFGYNPYNQFSNQFGKEFIMAAGDFYQNYQDMREANFIGADNYFHCKANFQGASRGPGGLFFAEHFSNLREVWDQNIKGYPREDSMSDQQANYWGRSQVGRALNACKACEIYRPVGLPDKY